MSFASIVPVIPHISLHAHSCAKQTLTPVYSILLRHNSQGFFTRFFENFPHPAPHDIASEKEANNTKILQIVQKQPEKFVYSVFAIFDKFLVTFQQIYGIMLLYFLQRVILVNENYGKLEATLSTLPIAVLGMLIVGICFAIAVAAQIYFAVSGSLNVVAFIICLAAAVALVGYSIYTMLKCKVYLYENAMVVTLLGKKEEMLISDMRCILWDFPGAGINAKGPRKNVTTAEVIFKDRRKSFKISDGYYADVEAQIGTWQTKHKIPREL